MISEIGGLSLQFETRSHELAQRWDHLFAGLDPPQRAWPSSQADIQLCFEPSVELEPAPGVSPIFEDEVRPAESVGRLTVYRVRQDQLLLRFHRAAVSRVPLDSSSSRGRPVAVVGTTTREALEYDCLEDIVFTTLAPVLRRCGYFLIHAFAATRAGQTVLCVGPSGSGKTTSGLALVQSGWQMLANDVTLLQERPEGIVAFPTPGSISVRADTLRLLPFLEDLTRADSVREGRHILPAEPLRGGAGNAPRLVTNIIFPGVVHSGTTNLEPIGRGVCLARLTEESVDRWDRPTLDSHLSLLRRLSLQVKAEGLALGPDVSKWPSLLSD